MCLALVNQNYIRSSFPSHPTITPGVLACLDSFMNIAMEQTEEYVHGQLKAKYGDCFIRGNNGTWMSGGRRGGGLSWFVGWVCRWVGVLVYGMIY